jgi:pimeloyl-ACP methyl ester carboxylesterase
MVLSPALAEALLFQPSRGDPGPPPVLDGVPGESIRISTADGLEIQGWWYALAGPRSGEVESGRSEVASAAAPPAVLLLHGNAGDISHRTPLALGLIREGFSVLLLEYRGYGGSEGSPSENGLHLDALAAHDFLLDRLGGSGKIVVLGRSMGGAVGAGLAVARPTGGLILESAFTSLEAMAREIYPFVPGFLFRRLRGRFDTVARVREASVPMLVVHGSEDEVVPFRMGEALYRAAGPLGEWMEVPGAGHNDVFQVGGTAYFRALGDFIRRIVGGEPGGPGSPR